MSIKESNTKKNYSNVNNNIKVAKLDVSKYKKALLKGFNSGVKTVSALAGREVSTDFKKKKWTRRINRNPSTGLNMPGYPPRKVYANSYNKTYNKKLDREEKEERKGKKKDSKKFETVGKPNLTEEQKAYTLQELKKIKRKKLLKKAKKN